MTTQLIFLITGNLRLSILLLHVIYRRWSNFETIIQYMPQQIWKLTYIWSFHWKYEYETTMSNIILKPLTPWNYHLETIMSRTCLRRFWNSNNVQSLRFVTFLKKSTPGTFCFGTLSLSEYWYHVSHDLLFLRQ